MKKYILYVGLNDKDTKQQKIDTLEAYKITTNILLNYTDGATIYSTQGIYKHNDNTIVIENTLKIELLFIELETVKKIANELKIIFNQETIILQTENFTSDLI